MSSFTLIIPTYNEEQGIEKTLNILGNFFKCKSYDYEIIVVNDGSEDNTSAVIEDFKKENDINIELLEYCSNKGKGYAVLKGIHKAEKEIIAFMDADLPFDLSLIESSIKLIQENKAEIVIGDRGDSKSSIEVAYSYSRRLSGKLFSILINILLFKGFNDTQCGYKAFKNKVAKDIFSKQTIPGFGFDVEILFIAIKKKYEIKKIPVIFSHSRDSKIKLIRHSLEMFFDIFRIRSNNKKGIYD
tara:strand:+ start:813 stop:1541 length:729 start_codon:yes stop_codon:yes gene_type:complete